MGSALGGGDDAAKKAAERAEKNRKDQELRMQNEQALADANAANAVVDVQQGGTDTPETVLDTMRKRKARQTTSNQLGIV